MFIDSLKARRMLRLRDFYSGVKSAYTLALGHNSGCLWHNPYTYLINLLLSVGHASVARSIVHCHAAGMNNARYRRARKIRKRIRGLANRVFISQPCRDIACLCPHVDVVTNSLHDKGHRRAMSLQSRGMRVALR